MHDRMLFHATLTAYLSMSSQSSLVASEVPIFGIFYDGMRASAEKLGPEAVGLARWNRDTVAVAGSQVDKVAWHPQEAVHAVEWYVTKRPRNDKQ